MPELPDVEAIKVTFDHMALRRSVEDVQIENAKVLQNLDEKALRQHVRGRTFVGSRRYGKYLLALLDSGEAVVFHFGMTGYLHKRDGRPDKYRRVIFCLNDRQYLEYVSKRMLGGLGIIESVESFIEDKRLGPDARSCTREEFVTRISASTATLKSALMDQSRIAGLGNIYSDEILYQARLHPKVEARLLDEKQLKSLYHVMHRVLDVAIRHHANPSEMPSGYLLTHRKSGQKCPKCGGEVQKITVSGRSSYFCGSCQKK